MILDGQTLDARNPDQILARIGAVAQTDSRLADARPPRAHTHAHTHTVSEVTDAPADFFTYVVTSASRTVTTSGGEPVWAKP